MLASLESSGKTLLVDFCHACISWPRNFGLQHNNGQISHHCQPHHSLPRSKQAAIKNESPNFTISMWFHLQPNEFDRLRKDGPRPLLDRPQHPIWKRQSQSFSSQPLTKREWKKTVLHQNAYWRWPLVSSCQWPLDWNNRNLSRFGKWNAIKYEWWGWIAINASWYYVLFH